MKLNNKVVYILISVFISYTLLFSGFIYYSISKYDYTDFFKRLEIRAVINAKIYLENTSDFDNFNDVNLNFLEDLPSQSVHFIPMQNGKSFSLDSVSKKFPKEFISDIIEKGNGQVNVDNTLMAGIEYTNKRNESYLVIVTAENYFHGHHIAYLGNLLTTAILYSVFLIFLISLLVSRTLIHPVNNIIQEVEKIGTKNLHLRLKTTKTNDTIDQLSKTFNRMLNRLETSFESQKNFISNASHELNTPLASIIGEAELALSRPRDIEEYKSALHRILIEAEKLEKKTSALLQLAQTGFNGKSQKFTEIRIDQLILDVQATVSKVIANPKINLDFSLLPDNPEKLIVHGNEQLLHLAIYNILINALKYSDGKLVHIALGVSLSNIFIIVKDAGIGIPEKEIKYIYDPYFRASNTTNYKGYGIGLPLTRNIVIMHHGELIVSSEQDKGTVVQINLPIN
ncbi:sensor histidine kinase [Crocinitomix algicola]|uniref:sensor histidine kinase n=1 Tax=Crocinitomix algicola TaxID=1740263 RepID=UPI000834D073|nr:ATP-binding protein [Crocinitomix algicola]